MLPHYNEQISTMYGKLDQVDVIYSVFWIYGLYDKCDGVVNYFKYRYQNIGTGVGMTITNQCNPYINDTLIIQFIITI